MRRTTVPGAIAGWSSRVSRLLAMVSLVVAAPAARSAAQGNATPTAADLLSKSFNVAEGSAELANGSEQAADSSAKERGDRWEFKVTPFFWAANINADISVENVSATASPSFDDILDQLEFSAMGTVEVRKGDWAFFSDLLYSELGENNVSGPLGFASVDVTLQEFFGSANVAYRFLDLPLDEPRAPDGPTGPRLLLEGYTGVRYTYVYSKLNFQTIPTISDSVDWWDPLVGLRARLEVTPKLAIVTRGDVGGWGVGSEHTWFLIGALEWRASKVISIGAGYAALYQDYNGSNDSDFKQTMQGPFVAMSFHF